MMSSRRLVGSGRMVLVLLAGGCADRGSKAPSTDTVPAAAIAAGDSAAPNPTVAARSPAPVPGSDSVVLRARVALAAARPGFQEWPPNAYTPVLPDKTWPTATTGPLVGDFDGDGMPDVVFDGHDGRVMVTTAVLSNKGRLTIVSVDEGLELPDPPAPRRVRFVVSPYTLKAKRRSGVGFVSYDASGQAIGVTIMVYVDGHFAQWVEGE